MKNLSDDEDEFGFVSIGTALPQYDQDEVPVRKPVTIQEQTARDSKGRLRFHGAFTGGFSAGYFNTVDTEQGWTPTTFQSSRSQKAEAVVTQRPEDFMDDEDFSEYGIAPKKIATTKSFTDAKNDHKRKADLDHVDGSLIGANVLADLIIPCRSSIGMRLLRKLGWKDGQGIGPREKRQRRKATYSENDEMEAAEKVYGCALPPGLRQGSDGGSSEDDDEYGLDEMTFAPHDVSPITFDPKGNVHGLGYHGINQSTEILRGNRMQSLPITSKKGKMGIRGQAFGVGAFEEEDDDIYGIESLSNYDREICEGDDRKKLSTFGWTAPKHRTEKASYDDLMQTKDAIAGFMRSSTSLAPKKTYPPPPIPRDFRPFHKFDSVPKTRDSDSKQTKLNAFSRGVLLGEKPHLNSVFELVSTEDKARMEAAKLQVTPKQTEPPHSSATATMPPGDGLPATPSVSAESKGSSELQMASGSSTVFVPFARNPVKQQRYETYLDATKNKRPYVQDDSLSSHMTDWEKEREREEFAKAAHLFQPLSNMMASRFTRAKHDDDEQVVNLPAEEEKSAQAKAAELKMFGKLTRERCAWHPGKLVCRRFNIADPYPESDIIGLRTVKRDKCSIFNFLTFSNDEPQNAEKKETQPTKDNDSKPMKPLAILATVDLRPTSSSSARNEMEKAETPESASLVTQADKPEVATVDHTNERPPVDLFKAIFEDTDSESDSADDNVDPAAPPTDSVGNISPDIQKSSRDTVVTSRTEQSALQQIQESEITLPESSAMEANENMRISENFVDTNSLVVGRTDDVFGPALPPSTASPEARKTVQKTVADNGDKHRHHRNVKHKHKKHKSSSKKKHKKKQKKKTRMTSSSSNGSDADYESDVDTMAEIDQKILSRMKRYIEAGKTSTGKHK